MKILAYYELLNLFEKQSVWSNITLVQTAMDSTAWLLHSIALILKTPISSGIDIISKVIILEISEICISISVKVIVLYISSTHT